MHVLNTFSRDKPIGEMGGGSKLQYRIEFVQSCHTSALYNGFMSPHMFPLVWSRLIPTDLVCLSCFFAHAPTLYNWFMSSHMFLRVQSRIKSHRGLEQIKNQFRHCDKIQRIKVVLSLKVLVYFFFESIWKWEDCACIFLCQ